jgi:hypothetical protein
MFLKVFWQHWLDGSQGYTVILSEGFFAELGM